MSKRALFAGLVFNEAGEPAGVAYVGDEAHYVVNDAGFQRHVAAAHVDREVLQRLREQILENKELVTESALQMLGKDDLFTKAMIDSSLKNMEQHMRQLMEVGLPDGARQWLGMLGFRIILDYHGDVIKIEQPGLPISDDDL